MAKPASWLAIITVNIGVICFSYQQGIGTGQVGGSGIYFDFSNDPLGSLLILCLGLFFGVWPVAGLIALVNYLLIVQLMKENILKEKIDAYRLGILDAADAVGFSEYIE